VLRLRRRSTDDRPMEKGEQSVYADGVGRDAGRYKLSH